LIHNGGRHPAERTTPGGTSSMWMRTGMRCAKRTQVKVGLRVRDVDRAGDAVDAPARDLIMTHQLNLGPIAHADGSKGSSPRNIRRPRMNRRRGEGDRSKVS
jgi:hypothetical protein